MNQRKYFQNATQYGNALLNTPYCMFKCKPYYLLSLFYSCNSSVEHQNFFPFTLSVSKHRALIMICTLFTMYIFCFNYNIFSNLIYFDLHIQSQNYSNFLRCSTNIFIKFLQLFFTFATILRMLFGIPNWKKYINYLTFKQENCLS